MRGTSLVSDGIVSVRSSLMDSREVCRESGRFSFLGVGVVVAAAAGGIGLIGITTSCETSFVTWAVMTALTVCGLAVLEIADCLVSLATTINGNGGVVTSSELSSNENFLLPVDLQLVALAACSGFGADEKCFERLISSKDLIESATDPLIELSA